MGELEASDLGRARVGERALLAAEQLALDQRRRQRGAVDADEPGIAPGTLAVDRLSGQALPRAGLAEEQHRGVRRRDLLQAEPHVPEGIASADEIDRSGRRRRAREFDARCDASSLIYASGRSVCPGAIHRGHVNRPEIYSAITSAAIGRWSYRRVLIGPGNRPRDTTSSIDRSGPSRSR